jgi:hypothetical protein
MPTINSAASSGTLHSHVSYLSLHTGAVAVIVLLLALRSCLVVTTLRSPDVVWSLAAICAPNGESRHGMTDTA